MKISNRGWYWIQFVSGCSVFWVAAVMLAWGMLK